MPISSKATIARKTSPDRAISRVRTDEVTAAVASTISSKWPE